MDKIFKDAKNKMDKRVKKLSEEYAAIRAGRANPAVLDKIRIDYYDTPTPINQIAAVSVTEARILTIQPWDASAVRLIEKAIQTSDLGINPQTDGKVIRVQFPPLTEDRRREIVKEIHQMAEEAKISIRAIRREIIDKCKALEKKSEITKDDLKDAEKDAQKQTDNFVKEIDTLSSNKEKELMEI
ncbi:MAG: ribosome recycling factor [Clostridia bacterium]|nr:ribosome recycling factor [Clostridia bacterium]